ncbi:radical SAM protein [Nocardia salmonicida]|uniref:radical SAM protein n=1 Tax=Nocardia salmonicida TaxID=53431 RepID=UPI0033C927B8
MLTPGPIEQLQVLLTERCNLRCTHCAVPEEDSPAEQELTGAQWRLFLTRVLEGGVRRIVLSGGEALLRRDCLPLAEHALVQGAQAVIIVSNGTVLRRSTLDPLSALQRRWPNLLLHISIDGATPESHELIRGKGTFERTMAGLRRLRAAGGNIAGVHTVVHQANAAELAQIADLVRELGASTWTIFPVASLGRGRDLDAQRLDESQWRAVMDYLAADHLADLEVGLMGPTLGDEWRSVDAVPRARAHHSGQAVVGPDGNVFTCPPLRERTVGSVSEVLAGGAWAEVDAALRAALAPACPSCKFRPLCTGVDPDELVEPTAAFRDPGPTRIPLPLIIGSR